jgi:hypothetical protein
MVLVKAVYDLVRGRHGVFMDGHGLFRGEHGFS